MSVAFTKEDSAQTASETVLPDRPIPPGPNLVTQSGLEMLQALLGAAQQAYETAAAIEDIAERRQQSAVPLRDIRYLYERVRTAQVVPEDPDSGTVSFGKTITFKREDGRRQTFRIVGEDEADPKKGSVSHGSPLAQALLGKTVGDQFEIAGKPAEITDIE